MTSKERQERLFKQLEVDRPAVHTRTGYPPDDPTYDAMKRYMEEFSDLRGSFWCGRVNPQGAAEERSEQIDAETVRQTLTMHTPAGDLTSTILVKPEARASYHESYYIKNREDALKYLSQPLPAVEPDVNGFFETERALGDRGVVFVNCGNIPGGHIAELCGSTTLALMTLSDRDVLHAICERELTIYLNILDVMFKHNIGPYFSLSGEEYFTPPLHGPVDFADFVSRYEKPIIDKIHDAGGFVHIHCHGPIGDLLDAFVALDPDMLHPVEPPPMGDVTAARAKEAFKGKICIEGNIQIAHMYEHTPEEVAEETKQLMRDAFFDHKGLVAGPTASPYIFGKGEAAFPQYKAMVETVLNFK